VSPTQERMPRSQDQPVRALLLATLELAARRFRDPRSAAWRRVVTFSKGVLRPLYLAVLSRVQASGMRADRETSARPNLLPGEPAPILSYAQNAEDVVLLRAFSDIDNGFYVDVGAGDPVDDSVSKVFYDRGWHGINVEPQRSSFRKLESARSRDINLNSAVSDRIGTSSFFVLPERPGRSTLTPDLAEFYRSSGQRIEKETVELTTLKEICEEFAPAKFEFLKIDAEGHEEQILLGADFGRFRPAVIVIEATRPERWERILEQAGYDKVLFDGVNAFFVADERPDLAPRLAAPASSIDNYVPFRYQSRIDAADRQIAELMARVARLEKRQARRSGANAESDET
jgi:FkbM family methyltransferase